MLGFNGSPDWKAVAPVAGAVSVSLPSVPCRTPLRDVCDIPDRAVGEADLVHRIGANISSQTAFNLLNELRDPSVQG